MADCLLETSDDISPEPDRLCIRGFDSERIAANETKTIMNACKQTFNKASTLKAGSHLGHIPIDLKKLLKTLESSEIGSWYCSVFLYLGYPNTD